MADTYSPPAGARAAARRAIRFKEQGKANGAGTSVGWTRAGQLARGEALSLDTVKRMYSYFSRHEVDKKGKDWGNQANPSNGYIMWLAWGGDAGFSWSRAIVEREKKAEKALFENFGAVVNGPQRLTKVFDLEKKTDYGNIIKPRKGEPKNKELYASVIAAAKKKFKVYPSAVANAWVVAEYKRRGGKY